MEVKEMKKAFKEAYGHDADAVYFSPGRVNLIGEHTDYNGGFVFPCALSFGTYLLIRKNGEKHINFRSLNVPKVVKVSLDNLTQRLEDNSWANYPLGVFAQFVKRGVKFDEGYDIMIWGNAKKPNMNSRW